MRLSRQIPLYEAADRASLPARANSALIVSYFSPARCPPAYTYRHRHPRPTRRRAMPQRGLAAACRSPNQVSSRCAEGYQSAQNRQTARRSRARLRACSSANPILLDRPTPARLEEAATVARPDLQCRHRRHRQRKHDVRVRPTRAQARFRVLARTMMKGERLSPRARAASGVSAIRGSVASIGPDSHPELRDSRIEERDCLIRRITPNRAQRRRLAQPLESRHPHPAPQASAPQSGAALSGTTLPTLLQAAVRLGGPWQQQADVRRQDTARSSGRNRQRHKRGHRPIFSL